LGGDVAADESTWTLQGSGNKRELGITLAKLGGGNWIEFIEQ